MSYAYLHWDVFTAEPLLGNQLAVFTSAAGLDTATMQRIAREMNFSESTFLLPAEPIASIDDYVLHYLELFDALRLGSVRLVGLSLGGWIAAKLATTSSHRLKKLVLVALIPALIPALVGACTDTRPAIEGTQSLRITLVSPTNPGGPAKQDRLPDTERTVVLNVEALDAEGQLDTSFDKDVQVYAQFLGTLTPSFGAAYLRATVGGRPCASEPYLMSRGNPYGTDSFPVHERVTRVLLAATYGSAAADALGWPGHRDSTRAAFDAIAARERWLTRTEDVPWAALLASEPLLRQCDPAYRRALRDLLAYYRLLLMEQLMRQGRLDGPSLARWRSQFPWSRFPGLKLAALELRCSLAATMPRLARPPRGLSAPGGRP